MSIKRGTMRYSVSFFLSLCLIVQWGCGRENTSRVQGSEILQAPNIKIDQADFGIGACEPSICIDPTSPNHIVAGSILDRVYYSDDYGLTWKKGKLSSASGVYGDPVVRADFDGNFYYSHLSNPTGNAWVDDSFLDRIVIQKSEDKGITWSDGSFTKPGGSKDQDKQWMAVDPNDNTLYLTWTEFDKYNSTRPEDKSRIYFTKSVDQGESWSTPYSISQFEGNCLDGDQTTEGAVPAVGPDGEVYVCWAYDEKLYFDRSFDKGLTWMEEDIVVADQPGGWTFDIKGINRCNGMPITEVDQSDGPHRGTIYVNWSDQRNGEEDTDIWLSKSVDKGMTWSAPKRVNDDEPGHDQFFTWMDVDPKTGYIYIVFYDRRAYKTGALDTDFYLAYSKDGGETFVNQKISEAPFIPNKFIFFGDYTDVCAYDGYVRPIWTALNNSTLSVWTALIQMDKKK